MLTNWRVLIIPEGIRLQMKLGKDDLDTMMARIEPQLNLNYLKIEYIFSTDKEPTKNTYYGGEQETQEFKKFKEGKTRRVFNDEGIDPVPENIVDIIKTTTSENLDILISRDDVHNYNDFSHIIGFDADGAIEALLGSETVQLVRSSYKSMVRSLENDHRYHRLSPEGKKQAQARLEQESKMKDGAIIMQWVERLEAYKNSRRETHNKNDMFNSVLDGLK